MKKILAVLLAVLVAFSALSVAVMAEETVDTTEAVVEENANDSIKNEDGLVVPGNMNQLKFSVIFKAFEKVINFFISIFESLFGNIIPDLDLDNELATGVGNLGNDILDRIEQVTPQA